MSFRRILRTAVWLLVTVVLPVAAVVLRVVLENAKTRVENGLLRFVVVVGLFLVVWSLVVLSSAVHDSYVGVVTFISLAIAVVSAGTATEMTYLAEHGRTVSCTVLDVDRRVEGEHYANGDGTSSNDIRVYYDHRLDCGDGGPSAVTKREALDGVGDRVELVFDPANRAELAPAEDVGERDVKKWTAIVLLVLTVLIRIVHVLVLGVQEERARAKPVTPVRRAGPVKGVSVVRRTPPPRDVAPKDGPDPNRLLRMQSKYHR